MKIFLLFLLLIFSKNVEELYSGQIYIANNYLSHYIRTAHAAQNKTAILQQLDHYLNKVDSTMNELRGFQRKCHRIESQYAKFYHDSKKYFPLVNLLKIHGIQSAPVGLQKVSIDERLRNRQSDQTTYTLGRAMSQTLPFLPQILALIDIKKVN